MAQRGASLGELTAVHHLYGGRVRSTAASANGAAEILLNRGGLGDSPEAATVDVVEETDSEGCPVVVVTTSDIPDDSVAATRHRVVFETDEDGLVRFVSGTWAQRCQPGRGHQEFATGLCT